MAVIGIVIRIILLILGLFFISMGIFLRDTIDYMLAPYGFTIGIFFVFIFFIFIVN